MRTVEVKVYQYDELSDKVKAKAREWWQELEQQDFGAHGDLFEAAQTAAGIMGIEFGTHPVKLYGGGTRQEPNIYFSGFSCQGDGASFTGRYAFSKGSRKAIRAEFGTDKKLWDIADGLSKLQYKTGYKLTCDITRSRHSNYSHSGTMDIDITGPLNMDGDDGTVYETLRNLMRRFADWIYDGLQEDYDDRLSDESAVDAIRANEYEFTEEGKQYR